MSGIFMLYQNLAHEPSYAGGGGIVSPSSHNSGRCSDKVSADLLFIYFTEKNLLGQEYLA